MKLGLVLECDTGGPDELVLTCLARRLVPTIEIQPLAMGNKHQVFRSGVRAAAELIESSKCDLVMIVWDLKPYWQEAAGQNCEAEADVLRQQLTAIRPATATRIKLLCLTWELETWLIADARAIRAHLSTPEHRSTFRCNAPLSKDDSWAYLDREFRKHRGRSRGYVDFREAIQIARRIPDTHHVRAVPSFERFALLVCNDPRAEFQQGGDVCNDLAYHAQRLGR